MSCLAEQAKILVAEAAENNFDDDAFNARWDRWDTCSLCAQDYHGVVRCALGWACWKTYVGQPETNEHQGMAMSVLGNGLYDAQQCEDALSVYEARLAMKRRLGASEQSILIVQNNLAGTYSALGRLEQALLMFRNVYTGRVKILGEEDQLTLSSANNYAGCPSELQRFKEAKMVLRKVVPVARRAIGESQISRSV